MFDGFLKGTGPARVFVYYQSAYKITEAGDIQELPGREEFYVTDGKLKRAKNLKICRFHLYKDMMYSNDNSLLNR